MSAPTDATHAPALRSWVASANVPGHDFPIQNLPLGCFRRRGSDEALRTGVAIGDQVLDLRLALEQSPWPRGLHELLEPLAAGDLARFMALGRPAWKSLRAAPSATISQSQCSA